MATTMQRPSWQFRYDLWWRGLLPASEEDAMFAEIAEAYSIEDWLRNHEGLWGYGAPTRLQLPEHAGVAT